MAALPLLAAGLDWLEGILPLLFLLFWIVSQVRALFRGAGPGKPPVPRPQRPALQPPAIDGTREELARQIEEFVRRSSSARQPIRTPPRKRDRGDRPGIAGGPQRVADQPLVPASRREPPRAVPAAGTAPPTLGSLGGHGTDVARHVREAFAGELEHLPAGLGRADAAAPAGARRPLAADLVAALRDPATLRQIVLAREVLDRPVERW